MLQKEGNTEARKSFDICAVELKNGSQTPILMSQRHNVWCPLEWFSTVHPCGMHQCRQFFRASSIKACALKMANHKKQHLAIVLHQMTENCYIVLDTKNNPLGLFQIYSRHKKYPIGIQFLMNSLLLISNTIFQCI